MKEGHEMEKQVQILDCTLRDGGLAFEDADKSGYAFQSFTAETAENVSRLLTHAGIDMIELGSIEITEEDRTRFCIYQSIEEISKRMPGKKRKDQMYAALFRGPDTNIDDIPCWNTSLCEAVRVIIRYSELEKSLDFCGALSQKGYKVCIQPMLTMRYSKSEIQLLIDRANQMDAYALYFVDSYGYMQADDVIGLYERYDRELKPSIKIGFHAHNNMDLAFSNALAVLERSGTRALILDSCIMGVGQGAGNLQTEIISDHLNRHFGAEYHFTRILAACQLIERYWTDNTWGYSVIRLLSAIHKTAYKYALELRKKYNLSLMEIDSIFSRMPEELRHRYTPDNTKKLLEILAFEKQENGIEL